jgi:hypothetical protein
MKKHHLLSLILVAAALVAIATAWLQSSNPARVAIEREQISTVLPLPAPSGAAAPQPVGAVSLSTVGPALSDEDVAQPAISIYTDNGQVQQPQWANARSERITLRPSEQVEVAIDSPDAGAASQVAIEALDGGVINDSGSTAILTPRDGTARFRFTASTGLGTYQVVIRTARDERCLRFWVAQDSPATPGESGDPASRHIPAASL